MLPTFDEVVDVLRECGYIVVSGDGEIFFIKRNSILLHCFDNSGLLSLTCFDSRVLNILYRKFNMMAEYIDTANIECNMGGYSCLFNWHNKGGSNGRRKYSCFVQRV